LFVGDFIKLGNPYLYLSFSAKDLIILIILYVMNYHSNRQVVNYKFTTPNLYLGIFTYLKCNFPGEYNLVILLNALQSVPMVDCKCCETLIVYLYLTVFIFCHEMSEIS